VSVRLYRRLTAAALGLLLSAPWAGDIGPEADSGMFGQTGATAEGQKIVFIFCNMVTSQKY